MKTSINANYCAEKTKAYVYNVFKVSFSLVKAAGRCTYQLIKRASLCAWKLSCSSERIFKQVGLAWPRIRWPRTSQSRRKDIYVNVDLADRQKRKPPASVSERCSATRSLNLGCTRHTWMTSYTPRTNHAQPQISISQRTAKYSAWDDKLKHPR